MSSLSLARGVFLILLSVVTWLTVTPNPDDTQTGFAVMRWVSEILFGNAEMNDKIAHFAAYGVLGFSAFFANIRLFGQQLWTVIALALYGAFLEVVQGLGGVRQPEVADAIANMLGTIAGFGAGICLLQFVRKNRA